MNIRANAKYAVLAAVMSGASVVALEAPKPTLADQIIGSLTRTAIGKGDALDLPWFPHEPDEAQVQKLELQLNAMRGLAMNVDHSDARAALRRVCRESVSPDVVAREIAALG
jgi:FXSXX-COOH protein